MKNLSVRKKVLTGIVAASIVFTLGTTALAASNTVKDSKSVQTNSGAKNKLFRGKGILASDNLKAKLDELVKAGTITQAQEDKIVAYMEQVQADIKAEKEKIEAMTEDERKAYLEQNKGKKTGALEALVSNGTITQVQADAMAEALGTKGAKGQGKGYIGNGLTGNLDSLVTAGTITEAEKTKILAYIEEKQAALQAEKEKVKAMTEEERKAYFADKTKTKVNILEQLVTDKIITQAQADAIAEAMPGKGAKGFKGNKGQRGVKQSTQQAATTEQGA